MGWSGATTPRRSRTACRPARGPSSRAASGWPTISSCSTGTPTRALFEKLLELRNDVGLLPEMYDPVARRMLRNFPQAFSHVGPVNTAFNLSRAEGPAEQRSAA